MTKSLLFTILCLSIVFSGCAKKSPLRMLEPEDTVLCFGDSITFGLGAALPDQSYPSVLETIIQRQVVNGGVPGEQTSEGLERLREWLNRDQPALVILCEGGNDMLRHVDERIIVDQLRKMIHMAKSRGADVVLIGVPHPGLLLRDASFYSKLAREEDVPYAKQILSRILSDPLLRSDQIHPNEKGYQMLAKSVAELLREQGAV
ncbi:MAG: arylesterase [Candidatus Omnitrophica bacterium]|nr:arylesterase [Candidatus Omnitrophota bacterium]